jgi:tetratricopeptide (TPR) repeat protein|tara:strand:+ start:750 stop:1511 length:762 start_codon:yes stop_codon:yes gene_type:complete
MKFNMKKSFYIVFLLFKIGFSQTSDLLFEKGNELYNKGEFELAINEYNKILENELHSPELYFNLGNCFYKLNEVAKSNFYFEKALILSPKDQYILKNLSFAKNMILDSIEELPKTQVQKNIDSLIFLFSFRIWSFMSIGFMLIFFISSLFYLFSYNSIHKRFYFSLSIVFLSFSFLTSNIIWKESKKLNETKNGIIFAKELSVFSEPNSRNEEIFILHEGTKVQLMDKLKGWEKIRLVNGSEGWVIENQIKTL